MGATSRSDITKSLCPTSQSDLARATPATCPERRTEVARISHPSRSDLPKQHPEVARVSMARRHEAKPGATSQSDPLRSLPKAGATCRSDMPRSLCVYCWSLLRIVSRLKVDSLIDHLPSLVRYLITQGLIPMPMKTTKAPNLFEHHHMLVQDATRH
ncbi:hypothetical protein YC2023_006176 [Brassica napus]